MSHDDLQKNLFFVSVIGLLVVAFWPRPIIEERV